LYQQQCSNYTSSSQPRPYRVQQDKATISSSTGSSTTGGGGGGDPDDLFLPFEYGEPLSSSKGAAGLQTQTAAGRDVDANVNDDGATDWPLSKSRKSVVNGGREGIDARRNGSQNLVPIHGLLLNDEPLIKQDGRFSTWKMDSRDVDGRERQQRNLYQEADEIDVEGGEDGGLQFLSEFIDSGEEAKLDEEWETKDDGFDELFMRMKGVSVEEGTAVERPKSVDETRATEEEQEILSLDSAAFLESMSEDGEVYEDLEDVSEEQDTMEVESSQDMVMRTEQSEAVSALPPKSTQWGEMTNKTIANFNMEYQKHTTESTANDVKFSRPSVDTEMPSVRLSKKEKKAIRAERRAATSQTEQHGEVATEQRKTMPSFSDFETRKDEFKMMASQPLPRRRSDGWKLPEIEKASPTSSRLKARPWLEGRTTTTPIASFRNAFEATTTKAAASTPRPGAEDEEPKEVPLWLKHKMTVKSKLKGEAWAPYKKVSPDARQAIKLLARTHPEFNTKRISEIFRMDPEAIRRIIHSKYAPTPEEQEEAARRWVNRGDQVWQRWMDQGAVMTKTYKYKAKLRREAQAEGETQGEEEETMMLQRPRPEAVVATKMVRGKIL